MRPERYADNIGHKFSHLIFAVGIYLLKIMIFAIRTILNANSMDELPLVTSTADRSTSQPSGGGRTNRKHDG